jgi:hypothetical protein
MQWDVNGGAQKSMFACSSGYNSNFAELQCQICFKLRRLLRNCVHRYKRRYPLTLPSSLYGAWVWDGGKIGRLHEHAW